MVKRRARIITLTRRDIDIDNYCETTAEQYQTMAPFHLTAFFLSLFLYAATAQQPTATTVSIFDWGPGVFSDLVPSVVAADPTATTYQFTCPPANPSNCRIQSGYTAVVSLIQGPSTAVEILDSNFKGRDQRRYSYACAITANAPSASCTYLGPGSGPTNTMSTKVVYITLTVTEGVEKLAAATQMQTGTF